MNLTDARLSAMHGIPRQPTSDAEGASGVSFRGPNAAPAQGNMRSRRRAIPFGDSRNDLDAIAQAEETWNASAGSIRTASFA